jgi:hypothetical protein
VRISQRILPPLCEAKYIAAQYNISSISWVSTGHHGSLVNRVSNCKSIFGGTLTSQGTTLREKCHCL